MAAIAIAMSLALTGPVHADSRMPIARVATANIASPSMMPNLTPSHPLTVPTEVPPKQEFQPIGSGIASYYGRHLAGARTANGERFNPDALTAAHRTLPFGTQVQVTNPSTGDSVVVTINDRGPFHGNRVIDLSDAAAEEIGLIRRGAGKVELAVLAD